MSTAGKTVWITGASSGIGAALARRFAADGARIIASGRRRDALEALAASLPAEVHVLPFEATDYPALPGIAEEAEAWADGIDMLVNNAGISQRSLAIDTGFDVYRTLMEVDFFAPLRLTQLVLPGMVARKSGHIAVISSVAGKIGAPLRTGYCAAKHACCGYFDALRAEVEAAYGIKVSVILPGSVRTSIAENAITATGERRGTSDDNIDNGLDPDDAAERIVAGLAAGDREIAVAEGLEAMALEMRKDNPEGLFDMLAQQGQALAAAREDGEAPDPIDLRTVK